MHGGARLGGAPCWETAYEVPFTDGLKPRSLFSPLLLSERDSHVFLTPRRGCKWHYTVFERLGKGIRSTEGRGHCLQPHLKPVAVDFSGQLGQEIKRQGKKGLDRDLAAKRLLRQSQKEWKETSGLAVRE